MTTAKERADFYRSMRYELLLQNYNDAADHFNRMADELDPPKPTWPYGTIAWVTASDGDARLCMRRKSAWASCVGSDGLTRIGIYDDEVTKVEPLRVLGDDEIAVRRIHKSCGADSWRMEANDAQGAKRNTYAAASLCRAYADALDAEAGDAK